MSAAGLRLRLCPFCGSEATLRKPGAVYVVVCDECKAEGPAGLVFDFVEFTDNNEIIPDAWHQAEDQARGAAIRGWNGRPHYGCMFPDEMERFEKESEIYWDESEL